MYFYAACFSGHTCHENVTPSITNLVASFTFPTQVLPFAVGLGQMEHIILSDPQHSGQMERHKVVFWVKQSLVIRGE